MLAAWSITEVIRYSYFVMNLRGEVPGFMTWLRYNTFYVLYPLGIGSEMACVYLASTAAATRGSKLLLWDLLFLYVPGELRVAMGSWGRESTDACRIVCYVYAHDGAKAEGDQGQAAGAKACELTVLD